MHADTGLIHWSVHRQMYELYSVFLSDQPQKEKFVLNNIVCQCQTYNGLLLILFRICKRGNRLHPWITYVATTCRDEKYKTGPTVKTLWTASICSLTDVRTPLHAIPVGTQHGAGRGRTQPGGEIRCCGESDPVFAWRRWKLILILLDCVVYEWTWLDLSIHSRAL